MKPVTPDLRRVGWRMNYRRGFDAAALTFFIGPLLGGIAFGVIGNISHLVLLAGAHQPQVQTTLIEELWVILVWPVATAFSALLMPAAWLASAVASLYVAIRVGITGWLSWAETVMLAVACSLFACYTFQQDFLSQDLRLSLDFLVCALCAGLVLRYVAGRRWIRRPQ